MPSATAQIASATADQLFTIVANGPAQTAVAQSAVITAQALAATVAKTNTAVAIVSSGTATANPAYVRKSYSLIIEDVEMCSMDEDVVV